MYKLQEAMRLIEELRSQLMRVTGTEPFEKRNFIKKESDLADVLSADYLSIKKQLSSKNEELQNKINDLNSRLFGLSKEVKREMEFSK